MAKPPSKAQWVADQLAIRIAAGTYRPGEWLPSGQAIGDELGAERGTVRRALVMLAERRLVEVIEGNGARVAPRVVTEHSPADMAQPANGWRGFGAAMLRAGQEPYVDVRGVREVEALPHIARWLGVPIGTKTLERDRVHGIVEAGNRTPVEIATTWIKLSVVERAPVLRQDDTGPGGMTARLAEAGYEQRYEDVVSSRHGDADEQDRLQVDSQQALTVVWRRTYDQADQVVKASQRVINPLRHQLVFRYP